MEIFDCEGVPGSAPLRHAAARNNMAAQVKMAGITARGNKREVLVRGTMFGEGMGCGAKLGLFYLYNSLRSKCILNYLGEFFL